MITDSTSAKSAREVTETLLTDTSTRKTILNFLADAILKVHKDGRCSGKWAVTLAADGRYVRLNVGVIEVFAIFSEKAHIIVDANALSEAKAVRLQKLNGENFEVPAYPRVSCSEMWDFPVEKFLKAIPILNDAYESLLEEAAASVKWRCSYYKSHSSGVLDYLRKELKRNIPDPSYE